jgi:hypothetical protein
MSSKLLATATVDVPETTVIPDVTAAIAADADVAAPIDPAKRIEFWGLGHLEAIITVLNSGATKERLEQAVLTRQKHPDNNELLTLNEQGDLDVLRLRYASWTSLQALITELKRHNVEVADMQFADHGKKSQA